MRCHDKLALPPRLCRPFLFYIARCHPRGRARLPLLIAKLVKDSRSLSVSRGYCERLERSESARRASRAADLPLRPTCDVIAGGRHGEVAGSHRCHSAGACSLCERAALHAGLWCISDYERHHSALIWDKRRGTFHCTGAHDRRIKACARAFAAASQCFVSMMSCMAFTPNNLTHTAASPHAMTCRGILPQMSDEHVKDG